jgi:hypothetical protein
MIIILLKTPSLLQAYCRHIVGRFGGAHHYCCCCQRVLKINAAPNDPEVSES